MHKQLVEGLAMLEGCLPVSGLNPAMHHLVHYGELTAIHGLLRVFHMFGPERYNKHVKNLCR